MMGKQTYTTYEVGEFCGVYPTTVINWIKEKRLSAYVTPGGHRRIRREDLVGFLREYGFPMPPELGGERRKVLIVDDDEGFARMLAKAFKRTGAVEVACSTNGVEALVEIGRKPPDLVVLDVVMPVVDGPTVCATLRSHEETKNLKIIGVTGKRLPGSAESALRKRCDAFFRKPLDASALVARALELVSARAAP